MNRLKNESLHAKPGSYQYGVTLAITGTIKGVLIKEFYV